MSKKPWTWARFKKSTSTSRQRRDERKAKRNARDGVIPRPLLPILVRICAGSRDLGITKKVTNIVSRHTFSTVLKRSGVSTEFIQESLGHTDKRTTENYLDSFEKEVKKEFSKKLIDFKKEAV